MMERRDSTRRIYRRWFANVTLFILCSFATLIFLVLSLESIEKDNGAVLITFGFVLFAIFLVPAARCIFYGVVVTESEVRVRNILRTHVLAWDEIDRFELTKYDPWPLIGVAVLKTGRRIPMAGIQWALLSHFAKDTVSALNDQLTARNENAP